MTQRRPTLCLDFDGVLHSYTSGWLGADEIPDAPVPGALEFCQSAVERFDVVVHSSRCSEILGLQAVAEWLDKFGFPAEIQVCGTKPPAFVTIDDRALTFTGVWPDLDELAKFEPWTKAAV
jgi:hypothetical protein